MNDLELSWTDFYSKDDLVSRIDEMSLERERLKRAYHTLLEEKNLLNDKYQELKSESRMFEKLYHDAMKKCWSIGL